MDKVAQVVGVALRLAPRSPSRAAGGFVPGAAPLPGSDDADAARRRCVVLGSSCKKAVMAVGVKRLFA